MAVLYVPLPLDSELLVGDCVDLARQSPSHWTTEFPAMLEKQTGIKVTHRRQSDLAGPSEVRPAGTWCVSFVRRLWVVYRVSSTLSGPVDPSLQALSGRLKCTVQLHKFNKYSCSSFCDRVDLARIGEVCPTGTWCSWFVLSR